jgi:thymidylate synthase
MNSGQLTPEGKLFIEREEARYLEELEKEGYKPTGASISFPRDNQPRRAEQQYLNHLRNIYCYGTDLKNERTGEVCRTIINCDMTYDCTTDHAPIVTTRKVNVKGAIAELLGYLKGYTSAAQFRELGTKSWDANANENQAWLANPNRHGTDDVGLIYGAVAREWPVIEARNNGKLYTERTMDLVQKVYNNLKAGKDDRGEIITFWNPGMFHLGALRPCLYEHQFSLLGDDLYLNSTQRLQ